MAKVRMGVNQRQYRQQSTGPKFPRLWEKIDVNPEQCFREKAPWYMGKLIEDFDLSVECAAAIVGNLGHESLGFTQLQELKPLVKGSRGGYGIAQWTGPRRVQFEAYCARNGLDPASDKANYGWLCVELKGSESKAIPAVKRPQTLEDKVIAFERAFLRAGVKHYQSRVRWAEQALAAYRSARGRRTAATVGGTAAAGGAAVAVGAGVDPAIVIAGLVFIAAAVGLFLFIRSKRNARKA